MNQLERNILLSSKEFRFRRVYWNDLLMSINSNTLLKQYGAVGAQKDFSRAQLPLDAATSAMINRISGKNRMLTYIIYLSLVEYLVHRYTGEHQVVVFVPEQNSKYGFNSILPLVGEVKPEMSYREFLSDVKTKLATLIKNQEYPIETVLKHFDNTKWNKIEDFSNVMCTIGGSDGSFGLDFHFDLHETDNDCYTMTLNYRKDRADEIFAESMLRHLMVLFQKCLSDSGILLGDIDYLTEEEKAFWNDEYNKPYGTLDRPIMHIFEEKVLQYPDKPAVESGDRILTYKELNSRANALAHHIQKAGVKKADVLGIIMDTTIEVVISMLAALKAGAVYLPINESFPKQRIEYMLGMGNVALILGMGENSFVEYKYIDVSDEAIYTSEDSSNPDVEITLDDCAYMIFTSGSTGKPKGAVIRHRGLANYITWAAEVYANNEECCFPLYSSISFDLTVTSIYTPLITGGRVVVYGGYDKGALIRTILNDNRVNIMKLTPAHLLILEEIECSNSQIEKFIVGGDNLKVDIVERIIKRFGRPVDIYNEYGPTEATVGCMIHRYDKNIDCAGSVSIGIPAANTRIFLLDKYNRCVPYGVCGEMYLAGFGLAKEYYNNQVATESSFIKGTAYDEGAIYKTGDYAFMKPAGEMEFLERRDNQIKLKGYRIGLGEIENSLAASEHVGSCVVRCVENELGQQLCAFLTVLGDATAADFREFLKKTLPDYMIPAHFYRVDSIPVNQNGKVDIDALLTQMVDLDVKEKYVAPSTPVEKLMVSIYEEILGKEKISILDDFFALGGDSIKAIRVAAKLYKLNYHVGIEEIFRYPQIQMLCRHLKEFEVVNEDLSGDVMLSPIQKYFFDLGLNNQNGYFQSMVIKTKDGIDMNRLRGAWDRLVGIHDAFRMRFISENGNIRCQYCDNENNYYCEEISMDETELKNSINDLGKKLSEKLDIQNGPLATWYFIRTQGGNYMFVMIHHLIMDGVSWRILLDDMDSFLDNAGAGDYTKTSSYMVWSGWVNRYANEDARQYELEYWDGMLKKVQQLFNTNPVTAGETKQEMIELDEKTTRLVIEDVHKAYNTDVTSFLIAALVKALMDNCGKNTVSLMVEGHGREILDDSLNISQTVGWFTSMYPVIISAGEDTGVGELLKTVKSGMADIPNKGFDYSILKYCRNNMQEYRQNFDKKFGLLFNYLGDISNDVEKKNFRQASFGFSGNTCTEEKREYALEINGVTVGGKIQFKATYTKGIFADDGFAGKLMRDFKDNLEYFTDYCMDICSRGTDSALGSDSDVSLTDMLSIEAMLGQIGIE